MTLPAEQRRLFSEAPLGAIRSERSLVRSTNRIPRVGPFTVALLLIVVLILAFIAVEVSIPLAGAIYALLFATLTFFRPDLSFFIIFAQSPLVWDLGGLPVKMAMADISLVIATPILMLQFLLSGRKLASNPLLIPILLYLLVCVLSTLMNGAVADSISSILQMLLYMGLTLYVYANCASNPQILINSMYGLLLTDAVLSIALIFAPKGYVFGIHKNALGSELDYAVVIAVELWLSQVLRKQSRWGILTILLLVGTGLIRSLSRGGWLGTVIGVLFLFILRGRIKLAIRSLLVLAPVVACCWILLPQESKEYAVDFGHSARNIEARYQSLQYAYNLFVQNPAVGMGVGLRKTYDATNLIMSTLAETGIAGLVTFLSIFVVMFWMVFTTCRSTLPTSPMFSLAAIGGALMAAKFAHGCVDHYWSRVMLPVWAAAGMAVYAYSASRKARRSTLTSL